MMNYEETLGILDSFEQQDGFSPADLLDFPEPIVAILRQLMSRKKKDVSALSRHFQIEENQVAILLQALKEKGLIISESNQHSLTVNLK